MEKYREQRCKDAAGDRAADAFETSAQCARDMWLQDDERGKQQPVAMIDAEKKDQCNVDAAYEGDACGVAQGERLAREIGAKKFQLPPLTQFAEPLIDVSKMTG